MMGTGGYRFVAAVALVALLGAAVGVSACASADVATRPPGTTVSPVPTATLPGVAGTATVPGGTIATTAPKPGVTLLGDGQSVINGTLLHRNLEGGVFVVVDAMPGPAAEKAKVTAVVVNPERADFASMTGDFVQVTGIIDPSAVSANMAGPQMKVTDIRVLKSVP